MFDNKKIKSTLAFLLLYAAGKAGASAEIFSLSLEELLSVQIKSTSFVEETLLETSYSVYPISSSEWQRLAVRNVGDLLNHMPSTVAPITFGQSRLIAIRGYLGVEPNTGTAVRLDGVPINKLREGGGQMALDGFDLGLLESVELIRGPGSALHGNDAFHGVLSLELPESQETGVRVSAEAGTLDDGAAAVRGTRVHGAHAVTLGLAYRNIGDVEQAYQYQEPEGTALSYRRNARENRNGMLKYRYQSGKLSVESMLYLLDFEAEQLPGLGQASFGTQGAYDYSDYSDTMQVFKLGGDYQITERRKTRFVGYYWQDQDRYNIDLSDIAVFGYDFQMEREESHWGLMLHDTHHYAQKSHVTWGYEFKRDRIDEITRTENPASPGSSDVNGVGYQRDLNSLLLDGHHVVNDTGLQLVYGVRWDYYNDFDDQFTPRIGLSQSYQQRHQFHLTYGEGFRAPSVHEIEGNAGILPNYNLNPETLQSLDLKYRYTGQRLSHTFTVFKNHWEDAINRKRVTTPDGEFAAQFLNVGESSARGIEYELRAHWQGWLAEFYVSYVRDSSDDLPRYFIPFPRWLGGFNIGHQFSGGLSLYCNNRFAYLEDVTVEGQEQMSQDSYFRTDLILNWQLQHSWSFDLVVRNLFDRDQAYFRLEREPDGFQDEQRNVSARLRYSF